MFHRHCRIAPCASMQAWFDNLVKDTNLQEKPLPNEATYRFLWFLFQCNRTSVSFFLLQYYPMRFSCLYVNWCSTEWNSRVTCIIAVFCCCSEKSVMESVVDFISDVVPQVSYIGINKVTITWFYVSVHQKIIIILSTIFISYTCM